MSILDTFLILFETDADKARREMKGVREEAKGTADSLDASVKHAKPLADGLGRANREASGLGRSLRAAVGLIGAVGALAAVNLVTSGLRQTVEEADRLGDASARIRLSAQDFDTWRRAVKASGGEMEDAEAALASYDEMLRRIQAGIGKRGVEALAALGLQATDSEGNLKDVRTSLLEVAEQLETMDRQAALRAIRRLGITDEGTVQLLLKGRRAIEELSSEQLRNGAITNEQADRLNKYKDSSEKLTGIIQGWKFALAAEAAPALIRVNEWLIKSAKGFGVSADAVKALAGALLFLGPALGIVGTMATIVSGFGAAAIAAFLGWAVAIAAVVAVVGLLAEDIYAFFKGQPSLIGNLMTRYEWFRKAVEGLGVAFRVIARVAIGAFQSIIGALRTVYAIFAPMLGLMLDIGVAVFRGLAVGFAIYVGKWAPILRAVAGPVGAFLRGFGDMFLRVFDLIGQAWDQTIGKIIRGVNMGVNAARSFLNLPGPNANALAAAQGQLGAAARSPWSSATSGSVQGARNSTDARSIGPVTVNTRATDAAGTGRAVQQSLAGLFGGATGELNDGVAR